MDGTAEELGGIGPLGWQQYLTIYKGGAQKLGSPRSPTALREHNVSLRGQGHMYKRIILLGLMYQILIVQRWPAQSPGQLV